MVFNAPIMAISLSQPNSSHSINETPGLLHSISTQRHTTFGGPLNTHRSIYLYNSQSTLRYSDQGLHLTFGLLLLQTLRLHLPTKYFHLTIGFLYRRSAKPSMPTAAVAPQPPGHDNIFFRSIVIWTLLSIHTDLPILSCTDLTVRVPLAGTPWCQGLHAHHLILCLAGQTGFRRL